MKDYNFNALQNLPVPESWIENALSIPEKVDRETAAVPFWRKPRFIATAASILLVTALSVGLYLSFGTGSPVPVKLSATGSVQSTDADASEFSDTSTGGDRQDNTDPTEQKSAIDRISGTSGNTSRSTSSGSDQRGTAPTTDTSPTEGSRNSSNKPQPTGGGNSSPTTAPDISPTEPYIPPTEPPIPQTTAPTEPIGVPEEDPTEEAWENPSEASWDPPVETPSIMISEVSVYLPNYKLPEDGRVYCKFVSLSSGKVYGDFGDYDDERLMTCKPMSSNGTWCSYNCLSHFEVPDGDDPDEVRYYIYDGEGNILLTKTAMLGSYG